MFDIAFVFVQLTLILLVISAFVVSVLLGVFVILTLIYTKIFGTKTTKFNARVQFDELLEPNTNDMFDQLIYPADAPTMPIPRARASTKTLLSWEPAENGDFYQLLAVSKEPVQESFEMPFNMNRGKL
jgi:hypothetical protein